MHANLEVIFRNSDAATRAGAGTRSRTPSVVTPGCWGKESIRITRPARGHKNGRAEVSVDHIHTTDLSTNNTDANFHLREG